MEKHLTKIDLRKLVREAMVNDPRWQEVVRKIESDIYRMLTKGGTGKPITAIKGS
mgnify:CR=1 FL=1